MTKDGFAPKLVLDLCASAGDFALVVRSRCRKRQVVLADFSMLLMARNKIPQNSGVHLLEADALKLPFQDMTFEAVVCGFGIRNLDSVEAGLEEIARVLKPGSKAVILEFFKPTSFWRSWPIQHTRGYDRAHEGWSHFQK